MQLVRHARPRWRIANTSNDLGLRTTEHMGLVGFQAVARDNFVNFEERAFGGARPSRGGDRALPQRPEDHAR